MFCEMFVYRVQEEFTTTQDGADMNRRETKNAGIQKEISNLQRPPRKELNTDIVGIEQAAAPMTGKYHGNYLNVFLCWRSSMYLLLLRVKCITP